MPDPSKTVGWALWLSRVSAQAFSSHGTGYHSCQLSGGVNLVLCLSWVVEAGVMAGDWN